MFLVDRNGLSTPSLHRASDGRGLLSVAMRDVWVAESVRRTRGFRFVKRVDV